MLRNIFVLVGHDLAMAFKNKSVFLILFIPLFVFVTLKLVNPADARIERLKIGLVENFNYPTGFATGLKAAASVIEVTWVSDETAGRLLVSQKKLDGLLIKNDQAPGRLTLVVLKKDSAKTQGLMQVVSGLQKAAEGNPQDWIADIQGLHETDLQTQSLPTWILIVVLLVGLIILPTQVAEEKEKKLLLALLQTPIHEYQWLTAKLISGMLLMLVAVVLLHLLGQVSPAYWGDYAALLLFATFCFSALGVFLGFLCRNQAGARALGLIVYLLMLLPAALSDYSPNLRLVAPALPSYQFFGPLKTLLLEDGRITTAPIEMLSLIVVGSVALFFSGILLKKRWLM